MMGNFFDNLTLCLPPDSVLYHTGMPSAILVLPRWTTQWAIQMTRFQMHTITKMKIVLSIYRSFLLVFVSSLKQCTSHRLTSTKWIRVTNEAR